ISGTRTGKRLLFVWCPAEWFPSDAVNAFAFEDDYNFGVLSSSIHEAWARWHSSTLEDRLRYTPTTAFATFPFPAMPSATKKMRIEVLARLVVALRAEHATEMGKGLTAVYNAVDEGAFTDLADAHADLDRAVCDAYGWSWDVLDSRSEICDLLLARNVAVASGSVPYAPF
ncbi:MAG TPA: type IIL restriction-modification enzyme MmeI, partial [Acidimicrobiia bacterium]